MDETRIDESEGDSLNDILNAAIDKAAPEESTVAPNSRDTQDETGQASQEIAPTEQSETTQTDPTQKTEPDEGNPFAPKHWTEAEKAAFAKAPPEVQQAINSLVKNLQKGFTQKAMASADARRFAEDVQTAFQPHHRAEMQRLGITEGGAVREFLKLQDQFSRDPVGYVKMIMRARGLTPQHLGFATTPADPYAPDPVQASPEIVQMQSELAALKGALQASANASVEKSTQHAVNMVTEFSNAIAEDGTLANPYFDDLQPQIAAYLQGDPEVMAIVDPAQRLAAAYERACWAHPTIRNDLLAREEAAKRQAWEAERSRSALSVKPRAGGPARRTEGSMSLDDALGAALKQFG